MTKETNCCRTCVDSVASRIQVSHCPAVLLGWTFFVFGGVLWPLYCNVFSTCNWSPVLSTMGASISVFNGLTGRCTFSRLTNSRITQNRCPSREKKNNKKGDKIVTESIQNFCSSHFLPTHEERYTRG